MNLRALQLFRQIVLTGSLADASTKLNLSSSAASRLIALLEGELGLDLFSRGRRRLELSDDGDRFYRQIGHTLDGLDALKTIAREIRERDRNWLSIVTAAPIAAGLVSPALARMRAVDPDFQCALNVESRFAIESKVAARSYNLGLISLPVENAIIELHAIPFLRARLGVLLPRNHPLAARESLSAAELVDQPFVGLRPRQRWRDRLDEVMGTVGQPYAVPFETSSTLVTLSLVRDGLGISLIDRVAARLHADDAAVLRPLRENYWITYASLHPDTHREPLAERFLDAVADYVEAERSADPAVRQDLELI